MEELQTKTVKVADIVPYEKNARINDNTVEELVRSISRFGYKVPIVIDSNNVIVSGHARLKAVQKLGYVEVSCVVMDVEDKRVKEFRLMDNTIHDITDWDFDLLNVELRGLDELEDMFPELNKSEEHDEDISIGKQVTEEDIQKTSDKLDTHFHDQVEGKIKELVDIKCPHCKEEYSIPRKEFQE